MLTNTLASLALNMESPATSDSRRSSVTSFFKNGITGRRRHASDSGLDIDPFSESFTKIELEEFLKFFVLHKIHKWKIYQHLLGTQIKDGKEVRNFPDINSKSSDSGWTALHVSCSNGHTDLVKVLIQCQADPNIRNNAGSTPIHSAIVNKSKDIVEALLEHDSSLVNSFNSFNGFYPLHTAAFYRLYDISKVLIEYGASVDQDTELTEVSQNSLTVFHLASDKLSKIRTGRVIDRLEVEKDDSHEIDQLKQETHSLLIMYLSKLRRIQIEKTNHSKGSLLHVLCSVDFHDGVRTILAAPYYHPPDLLNTVGMTPLVVALSAGNIRSAKELLFYDVNVNFICPHPFHMTALQLLIKQALIITPLHLEVVQLLLDKGADPAESYETDSPVGMATMITLDVKLLEKFLEYLDESNINTKDRLTGETILHFAVLNSSGEKIAKILEKGADILMDNNDNSPTNKRKPNIPMELSLFNQRGLHYFSGLQLFGLPKLISALKRANSRKLVEFFKTHLAGGSCDKNQIFLQELFLLLQSPESGLTREDLDSIIHYKCDEYPESIFRKTALSWANENDDRITSLELLKLERNVHDCIDSPENICLIKGLQCLKNNLSSDKLLPWIIETYQGFYKRPAHLRWGFAIMTVICELLILSYIPYMYDLYSDIDLAKNYQRIGDENSTFDESELWVCGDQHLDGFCAIDFQETAKIRKSFNIAFWITTTAIIVSTFSYIVCILYHSNPRFIAKLERRFKDWGKKKTINKLTVNILWKLLWVCLVVFSKVFWPIIHFARKIRYNASTKKSQEKQAVIESDTTWSVVKTVEHGLEASLQLFLQMWLLKPYFPIIYTWNKKTFVIKGINGIANFMTFDIYPACYIEKALGKIALTLIVLSVSASFNKCSKHGVPACEKPFRLAPMFLSVLLQIIGRLYAFRILFLLDSPLDEWKLLVFFCIHFLAVFIIKIILEESPFERLRRKNIFPVFLNIGKFFLSIFSSSIIMVHLHSSRMNVKKQRFLSHTCFFLLILMEHFCIILLPYITSSSFPPNSCLDHGSYNSVAITVMTLWAFGVFFHILHYNWSHPWAAINGPQFSVRSILTRFTRGSERVYTEDYQIEKHAQEGYTEIQSKDDCEMTDIVQTL